MSHAVDIKHLSAQYEGNQALKDIHLTLPAGKSIGIVGPNGSGKTTLLRSIMGLTTPQQGTVDIFGKPLNQVREQVSYIPQRGTVDWDFPATVRDIVRMGRYRRFNLLKKLTRGDRKIADEALEQAGLTSLANRQIAKLSGGQQQRVFIARALAQKADLYLMDEPFAGVDVSTENAIIELLHRLRDQGKTVIIVHHDLNTVSRHFEHMVLLNAELVASGPKEEVFTRSLLEKTYGGRLNMLSQQESSVEEENL